VELHHQAALTQFDENGEYPLSGGRLCQRVSRDEMSKKVSLRWASAMFLNKFKLAAPQETRRFQR
jgi:hypothetical protein